MSIKDLTALRPIIFKIIKWVSSLSQASAFCVEIPGTFEEENKEEAFTFLLQHTLPLPSIRRAAFSLQFQQRWPSPRMLCCA